MTFKKAPKAARHTSKKEGSPRPEKRSLLQKRRSFLRILTAIPVLAISLHLFAESPQSTKPTSIFQSFVMNVTEDGKDQSDWFELWEVSGEFVGRTTSCSIRVASFTVTDKTHVHLWNHLSQRVTEVRPGIFRVEMNGRLNAFSDLDVVVELNPDRTRVIEMSGSMRSGSRGQSVLTFRIDRNNQTRKLLPLYNPSWLLEIK
jgi:hypothetical protein